MKYLFVLGLLFNIFLCFPESSDILFTSINQNDGLSSSWVKSICQDKYGFMWFGTDDGLNRYDGSEIIIFRPEANNPNSLINGWIDNLTERPDGKIWVCTELGTCILDPKELTFTPFPSLDGIFVAHVLIDDKGYSWFSTKSGLYVYNPLDSSIISYQHEAGNPNSINDNLVYKCFQDDSGRIWVSTNSGPNLYIAEKDEFIDISSNNSSLKDGRRLEFMQDKNGMMWFCSMYLGLYYFDPSQGFEAPLSMQKVSDAQSNAILMDSRNRLWVGTREDDGLFLVDLNSKKNTNDHYSIITNGPDNNMRLSNNNVVAIYKDNHDGMWVGTYAGGVNYYNESIMRFNVGSSLPGQIEELNDQIINCMLLDGDYFWAASEKGLYRYNLKTSELKLFKNDKADDHSLASNTVFTVFKDSHGYLWVGTWSGGLHRYDYQNDHFVRYLSNDKPGSISSNNIFTIFEDSRGKLWIGTDGGGLSLFDYKSKTFTNFTHDANNNNSVFNNSIAHITETENGLLLLSTLTSLDVYDVKNNSFTHYAHDGSDSTSISTGLVQNSFQDRDGNIWICTSNGLNLFDLQKGSFKKFTTEDGLPNNNLKAMEEDDDGNLWVSTNIGLSKLSKGANFPNSISFENFQKTDGLNGNEFMRQSSFKHPDGFLYFGTNLGYTFFNPKRIPRNNEPPIVALTDFLVFSSNENSAIENLRKKINSVETIALEYDQNDFTFHFASLNYLHPSKNKYEYMLYGYEDKWHKIGNQNFATYTNINPGTYTFKVRGSNNDGIWSLQPKEVKIRITPPWWDSILFKIFGIVLFISIIYIAYRIKIRLVTQQNLELEKKVAERTEELSNVNELLQERQEEISAQNQELEHHRENLQQMVEEQTEQLRTALKKAEDADRLKSSFLANMSHEVRTPMNAIVGFASLLTDDDLDASEKQEYSDIISNNCDTLTVLINDIMEISLIDANQVKLKIEKLNVNKLLSELESYFVINNTKDLKIEFDNKKDDSLMIESDAVRFRQVFTNLINNAYKYSHAGSIHFGYNRDNGTDTTFYVKDTGIGIDASEHDKIFDHFYKVENSTSKLYRGTGIGLSVCSKLVHIMGGKIWIESEAGKGSTFYFTTNSQ